MAWYHIPGNEQDVVVSTRISFARNLAGRPFTSRLDANGARELVKDVGGELEANGFTKTDFCDISRTMAYALVEQHYASPAFIKESLPHALYLNEPCNLSVMVGEEDHVRLQCLLPGLALRDAYTGAAKIERLLDEKFELAYHERWGYLTHCPANLGTAMRASVMVFLPALSATRQMVSLAARLDRMGLTVQGLYGDGSEAVGSLYRISNRSTLGTTEEETLSRLEDAARRVIDSERRARNTWLADSPAALTDRVRRAEGILRYCHTLSSAEYLRLTADVRLGVALGIIKDIRIETLTALMVEVMPATLTLAAKIPLKCEEERDKYRAELVQARLSTTA